MIYVECYPDITLVKSLTNITKRGIIHEFKGKGEICNRLRNNANSKGLIDEDPSSSQPRYLIEATPEGDFAEYNLKLLHHSSTDNRLIVLCPTLEEWILKSAIQANLDVRKYGLPNDTVKLHGLINLNIGKFEKLIEDLKDKSNRLKTLKRLLERPQ